MKIKLNFDTVSFGAGICTSLLIFISQGPYDKTWKYLLPFTPLGFVIIILTIKRIVLFIINSKIKYLIEELNFIKSTKIKASWLLRVENPSGDLHVTKCHLLKLMTNSRIRKTTDELIYSSNDLADLPPMPVIKNKNKNFTLKIHNVRKNTEFIDGIETKKYKWRYEINPPLSKKGDFIEYFFEYSMPEEVKSAFTDKGDILVLEQRNYFQDTKLSLIAPKSYIIVLCDSYIEDYDGTRKEIESNEFKPHLTINNTILEWKTKFRHFSRYICKYKLIKQ